MNRKAAGIVFMIGVGIAALAGTASAQNSPASAALDTSLRGAVERKDVPGVVALITDRDRVLYQSAFGVADVSTGRPLTTDALFRIASMTKAITSVALMQLIEQGRLGLDDPAEKYLPELVGLKVIESFDKATGAYQVRPASRSPTVKHFLTHTSGLAYPFTSEIWRDLKPRAGETYPFGGPLLFDPGERWHYSTSTDVVGKLVEVVSGQKLEDYFRQHIFAPLKMDDTSYNVPEAKGPRLVAQQQRAGARMDGAIELQKPQLGLTIAAPIGGGGLASTADDYGRFVRMLLNGGALDGARVLKAETVALMGQNHIGAVSVPALKSALPRSADFTFIADGRDKWGLGFLITADQVPGKRSPGSLSWGGINNTYFWIDPARGIAGVIMMQFLPFADTKALAIYDTFERGVYQLVDTQPPSAARRPPQTPQKTTTSAELERRDLPVTNDDLRILRRADELLRDESVWNRKDDRECDDDEATGKRSLFCALQKACVDVLGTYDHRRVALQEVRFAVEDATRGQDFEHRLRDFNNLPTTQLSDVKRVLRVAMDRVKSRLKKQ
jgi:CubicO group peptidase (beta-lactamase class C family)